MDKKYYTVDSIEDNIVRINSLENSLLNEFINLNCFNEKPKEGDVVCYNNELGFWRVDKKYTENRKKHIKDRFERLKTMKKRG